MRKIILEGYVKIDFENELTLTDEALKNIGDPPIELVRTALEDMGIKTDELESAGDYDEDMGGMSFIIPKCKISLYTSPIKCNLEYAKVRSLENIMGALDCLGENIGYSEWTITGFDTHKFNIGGHNLMDILREQRGNYIHLIIEFE